MEEIIQRLIQVRKVSAPLVGVITQDPQAFSRRVRSLLTEENPPLISWDCVRGLVGLNDLGREEVAVLQQHCQLPGEDLSPTASLTLALQAPEGTLLLYLNAGHQITEPTVIQAIQNLRDPFAARQCTLVLVGADLQLPVELRHDVIILEEPLPDRERLATLVHRQYNLVQRDHPEVPAPSPQTIRQSVDALQGLSSFTAENAFALAMTREGVNISALQEVRRGMIDQTPGLTLYRGEQDYHRLGGLDFIKSYFNLLFTRSPQPPAAVIWIDEIEKSVADPTRPEVDSGVGKDQTRTLLKEMQDNEWTGILAVGPPGCAKSEFAKATGNSFGVPTLELDLGGLLGSLQGQSEQNIRQALRVIRAIAGKGAFFIGTCNSLETLRPELIRRFSAGIWMFDLPNRGEKEQIWEIWRSRLGIPGDHEQPEDTDWSGSDIRNCCWTAWMTGTTLQEAAPFLTLSAQANPAAVENLRKLASQNRFRCASYPGAYRYIPLAPPEGARKINLE